MTRATIRREANHTLHLILTLFTCGLWLPVWVCVAVYGRRTTVNAPQSGHTPCVFHGRPYPAHDFYYGPQCRRCGAWNR